MRHSWDTEDDSQLSLGFSFNIQKVAITALKSFAWLDLLAGILCSIIIWTKHSTFTIPTGKYLTQTETLTSPVMVAVGIAVLLQGLFAWALFLVISSIAENLIAIRNKTVGDEQ